MLRGGLQAVRIVLRIEAMGLAGAPTPSMKCPSILNDPEARQVDAHRDDLVENVIAPRPWPG